MKLQYTEIDGIGSDKIYANQIDTSKLSDQDVELVKQLNSVDGFRLGSVFGEYLAENTITIADLSHNSKERSVVITKINNDELDRYDVIVSDIEDNIDLSELMERFRGIIDDVLD